MTQPRPFANVACVDKCIFLLTGDLHGRLSQESEERLRALRQDENTLLLDAGDAVASGNLEGGKKRDTMLARMSRIGYDAMAMGNRESHPFRKLLDGKTAPARFPILAANMMAKRQPLPVKVKSHILRRLPNGVRVAVIGIAPQMTAPESWWSRVTDYVFDAPEKTVAGLANKLRKASDLIVLLSHCGINVDRKLAEIENVDLILGGHSHLELFEQDNGAPILHSGHFGHKLGRAEVYLECGKVTKIEADLIPLNEPSKR